MLAIRSLSTDRTLAQTLYLSNSIESVMSIVVHKTNTATAWNRSNMKKACFAAGILKVQRSVLTHVTTDEYT